MQTVRSNEQMTQSMKGATTLLGSMNRQMNLPALQRIAMEFERENDIMDQRQDMMDDAIDDATGIEGDEEEGEDIVKEVLDEIGVDLNQSVRISLSAFYGTKAYLHAQHSLARLLQIYKRLLQARPKLPSLLVLAVLRVMTICKQDLTVYDDECYNILCFAS